MTDAEEAVEILMRDNAILEARVAELTEENARLEQVAEMAMRAMNETTTLALMSAQEAPDERD